jgi:uncharacterized membrane protein
LTSRNKAVLWILFVFMVGGVFGGTLTYVLIHPSPFYSSDRPRPQQKKRGNPEQWLERVVRRISKAAELDEEQQGEVRRILEASRVLFRRAAEEADSRKREIIMANREKIRAILRPEQVEDFNEYVRQREERRKNRLRKRRHR